MRARSLIPPVASRSDQTITISASRSIGGDRDELFGFLASSDNHRLLGVPGISLLGLDADGGPLRGGWVSVGPPGLRRLVRTHVVHADPPARLAGSALLESGTEAHVSWTLRRCGDRATAVELTAVLGPIARFDALLLALGGRRWLRRRFADTLDRFAAELADAPAAHLRGASERRGIHPSSRQAEPGRPGSRQTIRKPTTVRIKPNISPTRSP